MKGHMIYTAVLQLVPGKVTVQQGAGESQE